MASIGTLYANLALNSADFISGLKKTERQTTATTSAITASFGKLGAAVKATAAVFTVDFLAATVQRALDYADAIADLSDRTGASTKIIQEFRYAAQLSGSDVETADVALEKFTKTLGLAQQAGTSQNKTLRELGVTSSNYETALRQTIDGISKLPSVQQRNAAAMEIFGKKAGTLTVLLGQGTKGFDELAKKAQALGVVLGDDVVRNAGQANDQLDTMKMILSAQLASAIVKNAGALASLAQGIMSVVGAMLQFWQTNPRAAFAILGGIAGLAVGGPVGGIIGAGAGFAAGHYADVKARQANPALYKARDELSQAQTALEEARKGNRRVANDPTGLGLFNVYAGGKPDPAAIKRAQGRVARAQAEVARQQGLANPQPVVPTPDGNLTGNLPSLPGSKIKPPKASSGPSAADLAKMIADNLFDFNRDLADAQTEFADARAALMSSDPAVQAKADSDRLAAELKQRLADIDRDMVSDRKGEPAKLTREQGEQLKLLAQQTTSARQQLIDQQESERTLRDTLAIRTSQFQNEQDLLAGSSALARTAKERRAIELRILDLNYQRERAELEAVLASKTATETEKKIAQARLNILDQVRGNQQKQIEQGTMGPLETYLDSIPSSADEINEAFENIAAEGLQSLNDGIVEAIMGAKNLGEVFMDVSRMIIAGLLKIAVQKMIIGPIGDALFGGSGGLGGLFGGILKKADGGYISGPGSGRSDSIAAWLSNGEFVINARSTAQHRGLLEAINSGNMGAFADGGLVGSSERPFQGLKKAGGTVINVDASGSTDPGATELAVMRGIQTAMPMILENSAAYTKAKLYRPQM